MLEVSIRDHFSSGHHLRNYNGKCESPHGHNWFVEVYVRGDQLDDTGILIDFKVLKAAVKETLDQLDHADLNELPMFSDLNPTSENIARYLYEKLGSELNCDRYSVSRVSVHETPGSVATYWE